MKIKLLTFLLFLSTSVFAQHGLAYKRDNQIKYMLCTGTRANFDSISDYLDSYYSYYDSLNQTILIENAALNIGWYAWRDPGADGIVLVARPSEFWKSFTLNLDSTSIASFNNNFDFVHMNDTIGGAGSGKIMTTKCANDSIISLKNRIDLKGDVLGNGTTAQYIRGDGSKATFPTNLSSFTNGPGYLTSITNTQVIVALGFTPYNSTNPNGYINNLSSFSTSSLNEGSNLYYTNTRSRSAISLTTIGTSGAATYNSTTGVLNVPQYANSGGTVTSIGLTSSDFSVSGSPVTTSGNITANLNTSGITAGTYNSATYNNKGIATGGSSLVIGAPTAGNTFTSGTAFQPRSGGSCAINVNATLSGIVGVTGTVKIEMCATQNGTYTTVTPGTRLLISVLAVTADQDSGMVPVPSGWWVKITLTGGVTATYVKWDL